MARGHGFLAGSWSRTSGGILVQTSINTPTTSSPTTTSTSYVNIPETTVTITTHAGGTVLVFFAPLVTGTAGNYVYTGVTVDGVALSSDAGSADPDYISQVWISTHTGLSAGSHTFQGVWRVTGGTGYAFGVRRPLLVVEIY